VGRSKIVLFPGFLEMTRSLLVVLTIALFILTFIVQPFRIPSESMERTLLVGDFLLVNQDGVCSGGALGMADPYQPIERGDVVVFIFRRISGARGEAGDRRARRPHSPGERPCLGERPATPGGVTWCLSPRIQTIFR